MMNNKFVKGMIYGALIGGVITLFDKEVRQQALSEGKQKARQIKGVILNPRETIDEIQGKFDQVRNSIQQFNRDIQFLTEKASEIKELSLQTVKTFTDEQESKEYEKANSNNENER